MNYAVQDIEYLHENESGIIHRDRFIMYFDGSDTGYAIRVD